jgi:hypothetical protein
LAAESVIGIFRFEHFVCGESSGMFIQGFLFRLSLNFVLCFDMALLQRVERF